MKSTAKAIQVPRAMLGLHITQLFDAITSDWRDEQHLAEPAQLSERPFKRMKFPILASGDYSGFVLGIDHTLANPSIDLSAVVGPSEWDLAELVRPTLKEWRRRWWSSHPPPPDLVAAVTLTDERLPSWRERKQSRRDLPPPLPVPVLDLREALEAMAWTVTSRSAKWQRLTHPRHPLDLILPNDDVSASPALIELTFAWHQRSDDVTEAGEDLDLATVAAEYNEHGETALSDLIREMPAALSPHEVHARLAVASEQLRG